MNELLGNDLNLKNIDNVLHVLRNPYGWNDHVVRDARLAAADEIDRLRTESLRFDREPPEDCKHGSQCLARGACARKCSLVPNV